jgi:hypothetical protein
VENAVSHKPLKEYLEKRYGADVACKKSLLQGKEKIRKYFAELQHEVRDYIECSQGGVAVSVDQEGHLADIRVGKSALSFTADEKAIWVFKIDVSDPGTPKSRLIDELLPLEKKCASKARGELDDDLLDYYVGLLLEE